MNNLGDQGTIFKKVLLMIRYNSYKKGGEETISIDHIYHNTTAVLPKSEYERNCLVLLLKWRF